jgi:hypothetical protein
MDKANYIKLKGMLSPAVTAIFMFCNSGFIFSQVTLSGTSYTQTFDAAGTAIPTGWTVRTGATATALGTAAAFSTTQTAWSSTAGQFSNAAAAEAPSASADNAATQNTRTDRVIAVRQTGAFGDPGAAFVLQIANTTGFTNFTLSLKLMQLDPTATAGRTTTWNVDYGFGASPATFTNATTAPVTVTTVLGSSWGSSNVTVNFGTALDNNAGSVWIRIVSKAASSGSGSRPHTAIDDFALSWTSSCTAAAEPGTHASGIAFTAVACNAMTITWASGNGANRIVVGKAGSAVSGTPTDQTNYTANAAFGSGSIIAAGEFVIYKGTGNTVTTTSLSASTTYHFKVFEYNGNSCEENYLTSGSPLTGSQAAIACSECPRLTGVLINSCQGTCSEGDNELLFLTSGSYSIPVSASNIVIKYEAANPATVTYTDALTTNAAFINTLNTTAGCGTLFYDAMAVGRIPANTEFIVMRSTACYGYDFSTFCSFGPVYVVFSSDASWTSAGNFSNSCAPLRYFRTDFSAFAAGCTMNYSYDPCLLTVGGDGDAVSFPATGGAADSYFNDGCQPATTILPVELLSFSAESKNGKVKLSWTTASEINNDYYTVERSSDGIEFTPVCYLDGSGNSSSILNYAATDHEPLKNQNYYRLKQTDFDGRMSYSSTISVNIDNSLSDIVYPNPATETLNIPFRGDIEDPYMFEILNIQGIVLLKEDHPDSKERVFTMNIKELKPGTYILRFISGIETKQTLFIKQ